jgi:hypothetical protein
MKSYDRGSSIFCFLLAIYVCIGSLRLGVGTVRNPDMGFMTFSASLLLGLFSAVLFLRTLFKQAEAKGNSLFAGRLWKRVISVLLALLIYSKLMPVAGYLISTFLLMTFLFWIVRGQKWWWVLISSSLTTLVTYFVFSKWLNCQFPDGLLGL